MNMVMTASNCVHMIVTNNEETDY